MGADLQARTFLLIWILTHQSPAAISVNWDISCIGCSLQVVTAIHYHTYTLSSLCYAHPLFPKLVADSTASSTPSVSADSSDGTITTTLVCVRTKIDISTSFHCTKITPKAGSKCPLEWNHRVFSCTYSCVSSCQVWEVSQLQDCKSCWWTVHML